MLRSLTRPAARNRPAAPVPDAAPIAALSAPQSPSCGLLRRLGIFGFDRLEAVVLAAREKGLPAAAFSAYVAAGRAPCAGGAPVRKRFGRKALGGRRRADCRSLQAGRDGAACA